MTRRRCSRDGKGRCGVPNRSLAEQIRHRLTTGLLPREDPVKTRSAYGSGRPCAACDAPVWPAQTEYELDRLNGEKVPMHAGCHGLWTAERIRMRLTSPPPPAAPPLMGPR